LIAKQGLEAEGAVRLVNSKRRCACPNIGFLIILFAFASKEKLTNQ